MNKQLSYRMQLFAQIIRSGSFTAAAEHLGQTKSSLSQHLTQLESDLGTLLIQRTTRRLVLTEQGRLFYQRCSELVELLELAIDEVSTEPSQIKGSVTITAPQAIIDLIIIPVMARLQNQYIDLKMNLLVEDKQLDLLEHKVDLAIRVGNMADVSYKARRIGTMKEHWYESAAFKANEVSSVVCLPWQSGQQRMIRVNNLAAAAQLVSQGVGRALLPDLFVKGLVLSQSLIRSDIEDINQSIPIYAVHAYRDHLPLRVKRILDAIEAQFQLQAVRY
ncbi:LysR family transcriptional regulator [Shewanella surugensis]|uniref:LysR family transcriptional regulator n=1 Tax=Shewanella surugensis TaxID=212020 RepID=A0ABT0LBL8_9GAMM|nr:LysR family transcriptional regulator [Shewanella surugensis]MCL1125102.1 LysR family transcriptional regulator [Shewanella surugensis]